MNTCIRQNMLKMCLESSGRIMGFGNTYQHITEASRNLRLEEPVCVDEVVSRVTLHDP